MKIENVGLHGLFQRFKDYRAWDIVTSPEIWIEGLGHIIVLRFNQPLSVNVHAIVLKLC